MNTRQFIITFHLVLACFFLPLMLMMPLTGALNLWGYEGEMPKVEVFRIAKPADETLADAPAQEHFFREQFAQKQLHFDFEYIRSNNGNYTFRPASRMHYMASTEGSELVFYKMSPTLLRRMLELHKGHGPKLMRWYESAFGVALILVTLSGLWLVVSIRAYRRNGLIALAVGSLIILGCLL